MTRPLTRAEAEDLLYREAWLLDSGDWDSWVALYCDDVVFWMPAWRDEVNPTANPDQELSLIYYVGRRNLEERIWRARSGQSVASKPLPRVVHAVTNVQCRNLDDGEAELVAAFCTQHYDVRSERSHAFFGHYKYRIRAQGNNWFIAAKTIFLLNDVIPAVVDFYSI